ncbi:hypothetical protein A3841_18710 [Pontibacter flavimaris]|uniref:Uncharacterized protein n=1 Tax=Pontibacter flavimaris TaxID=1797110 RepID=A0A1Q5PDY1_9BACT|nr:hypothetical protein A3841_18710 [Pontibacter flavimaris]
MHLILWLPQAREGSPSGIALCSLLRQGAALDGHRISQGAQPKDWDQFDSYGFVISTFGRDLFRIPDRSLALLEMTKKYSNKYGSPLRRGSGGFKLLLIVTETMILIL